MLKVEPRNSHLTALAPGRVTPGCQRPSCVLCHPVTVAARLALEGPVFSAGWRAARDLRMLLSQQADQHRPTEEEVHGTTCGSHSSRAHRSHVSHDRPVAPDAGEPAPGPPSSSGAGARQRCTTTRRRPASPLHVWALAHPSRRVVSRFSKKLICLITTTAAAAAPESVATAQAVATAGRARAPSLHDVVSALCAAARRRRR